MKQLNLLSMLGIGAICALSASPAMAGVWKFGVMSDTQWTGVPADQANNPNKVAVSMIKQLNPQFIAAGVKFVVQVRDLTESGAVADIDVTAAARQALYNAGIGFFPLRGNHESSAAAATRFVIDFPQTQGNGANVFGAGNFSSPNPAGNGNLNGLSYSFDYNNARFVLLDQFTRPVSPKPSANDAIVDQIPWIKTTLEARPAGSHAFVFTHKNLMGENHMDDLFGSGPGGNLTARGQFIAVLADNGVRYAMSGHDHMHQRSIISSPADMTKQVMEIICGSDSSKFYTPQDITKSGWNGQKYLETPVAQDLYRVTYYIVTVDGPKVTVDYYASDEAFPSGHSTPVTPTLHFHKRETFGYSLNGMQFPVAQQAGYNVVHGTSPIDNTTTAKILAGVNDSTATDHYGTDGNLLPGRKLTKAVNTGWSAKNGTVSDVLTLWGMTDVGADTTDDYVLSMSYDPSMVTDKQIANGIVAVSHKSNDGSWKNAVDANHGGAKQFILGAYDSQYTRGTYGVDKATMTAWAVVDHTGDFAVAINATWAAGDFHQHSLHSDGSFPMPDVFAMENSFGLDWWANSEHGGNQGGFWRWMDLLGSIPTAKDGQVNSWLEVLAGRAAYPDRTIIQGLEWNVPGHEHCSMGCIEYQFGNAPTASPVAEFEYRWDGGDRDLSGGPGGIWTGKNDYNDHAKALQAAGWLKANYPATSWLVPAHPERKAPKAGYVGSGSWGYSIGDFRDLNNAAPDVCFGFESMPGHQKDSSRGGYSTSAVGGGTFGGCGYYAAKVGGLWDALLGEGRHFWLFASSDYHNNSGDYWPGMYQKTYTFMGDKTSPQAIVDGLRSGRSWVVEGDLIDKLELSAASGPMSAVMGEDLQLNLGPVTGGFGRMANVTVKLEFASPAHNNAPAPYNNTPVVDHVDIIAGQITSGIMTSGNPNYGVANNPTAKVIATYYNPATANGKTPVWTVDDNGNNVIVMNARIGKNTYFRVRGTNNRVGVNTLDIDANGDPVNDFTNPATGDAEAWTDMWFYSNPLFVYINTK